MTAHSVFYLAASVLLTFTNSTSARVVSRSDIIAEAHAIGGKPFIDKTGTGYICVTNADTGYHYDRNKLLSTWSYTRDGLTHVLMPGMGLTIVSANHQELTFFGQGKVHHLKSADEAHIILGVADTNRDECKRLMGKTKVASHIPG
jgi:hypothetical protein